MFGVDVSFVLGWRRKQKCSALTCTTFWSVWDLRVYFLCVRRHLFWCASMCAQWSARTQQLGDVYLERKLGGNHQFGGHICHFCFQNMCASLFSRVQEQTKTCGSSCNAEQVLLLLLFWRALVLVFWCVCLRVHLFHAWLGSQPGARLCHPVQGSSPGFALSWIFIAVLGRRRRIKYSFSLRQIFATKRRRSSLSLVFQPSPLTWKQNPVLRLLTFATPSKLFFGLQSCVRV